MLNKKALAAAVQASAAKNYVEDVFSTYLYTGAGSSGQTITNSIDLSTKGGFVWIKNRGSAVSHRLYDTARGVYKELYSDLTNAQVDRTGISAGISAFNTTGFSLGPNDYNGTNQSGVNYVSWTFRKQEKFFDVVTYTGNGVAGRTVAHNLGSVPGCIIVKRTSAVEDWAVYHRSLGNTKALFLNYQSAADTNILYWNNTSPTSTEFSVGSWAGVNANGSTYVAYVFAHDAGGFGLTGSDNVITCGSYTGNGSATGPTINLGYEPQWVLIKNSSASVTRWTITDNMRGFPVTSAAQQQILQPNNTEAEVGVMYIQPTATGFNVVDVDGDVNTNGQTYIYIAIRRGPMKTPTSGTSVFDVDTYTGDDGVSRLISSGFATDFSLIRDRNDGTAGRRENYVQDRLRGGGVSLVTNSTGGEGADTGWTNTDMRDQFRSNTGILTTVFTTRFNASGKSYVSYQFARAPGFFDVVTYAGTGSAGATTNHNLGVSPELIITKVRNFTGEDWIVHYRDGSTITAGYLNKTDAFAASGSAPSTDLTNFTSSSYERNTSNRRVNSGSYNYVAYLFATLANVSKIGTYTGNGTSVTVTTNFQPRFILVKRTDSTGNWLVSDSARGLVAGNDPYILLNTNDTEDTDEDWVDISSTSFTVNQTTDSNANINTGTYLYLAIA